MPTFTGSGWPCGNAGRPSSINPDAAGGYAGLGVVLGMKERYWSSVPLLKKAHDLDPENADISNNLGNAYYIEGKTEKAIAQLRTALRHHPKPQLAEIHLQELGEGPRAEVGLTTPTTSALATGEKNAVYHQLARNPRV